MILKKSKSNLNKSVTMTKQIQKLIFTVIVPFVAVIIILFYLMMSFNQKYAASLQNANTVTELNYEFKNKIDQDTYQFIIRAKPLEELPLEEIDRAKQIIERLEITTTYGENQWRVEVMLNLMEKLRQAIIDISNTSGYDTRIEMLNGNVHSITTLIQSYMNDYTYSEMKELAAIQKQIINRVSVMIWVTIIISAPFLILILLHSWRLSSRLTKPILELCEKASVLGSGNFDVEPIVSYSAEIQTLDHRFNEMANRIDELLACVKEDQNALHKAELELLQSQINPHFLYNTFDSVVWLAETKQNDKVIQMVTSLSSFFRNSLSKGQDFITLEVEIHQVTSYLEIQQIRYFDILEYEIDIPNHLKTSYIPKLTLQPIVENAIYHGIKNKRQKGKIKIYAQQTDADILISIHDNGAGMTPERLENLKEGLQKNQHSGLGLENVSKRLDLYFGSSYGLCFESTYGEGMTVTVRIPK
ncbi:sensor histidine kinase [Fusibacter sp. 3D3]|uniref:sensor histidine kinase n=1 Tax=Fusibacter sp. 3D3 TaxID=1048380 RepID=UPI0008532683|nr:sensor histidine kinase [Fusibacter sp. 3D3]GAU78882.1 two-component sensor kinase YesM [Fusibacter sp. 3D3]